MSKPTKKTRLTIATRRSTFNNVINAMIKQELLPAINAARQELARQVDATRVDTAAAIAEAVKSHPAIAEYLKCTHYSEPVMPPSGTGSYVSAVHALYDAAGGRVESPYRFSQPSGHKKSWRVRIEDMGGVLGSRVECQHAVPMGAYNQTPSDKLTRTAAGKFVKLCALVEEKRKMIEAFSDELAATLAAATTVEDLIELAPSLKDHLPPVQSPTALPVSVDTLNAVNKTLAKLA